MVYHSKLRNEGKIREAILWLITTEIIGKTGEGKVTSRQVLEKFWGYYKCLTAFHFLRHKTCIICKCLIRS
jgi:hypothetical protein